MVVAIPPGNRGWEHVVGGDNSHPGCVWNLDGRIPSYLHSKKRTDWGFNELALRVVAPQTSHRRAAMN
jgi:hypothetical protein